MPRPIEDLLPVKPELKPRHIYAYSIDDTAHAGLLKVGPTSQDVKKRVKQQLKTAAIKNYKIVVDELAETDGRRPVLRSRCACPPGQEGLREHRAGVDALHRR